MRFNIIRHRPQRGSIYMEVIITSMMLVTTFVSIAKYAQHSQQLDLMANQRLATRFACENTFARMQSLDFDVVEQSLSGLIAHTQKTSGIELSISVTPFDRSTGEPLIEPEEAEHVVGLHVMIESVGQTARSPSFRMHRWMFPRSSAKHTQNQETDSDEPIGGTGSESNQGEPQ